MDLRDLRTRLRNSRVLRFVLPGWHIKRWLAALFLGILLLSLGFAYVLVHVYRTAPFPSYVYYLTLQFIPHVQRVSRACDSSSLQLNDDTMGWRKLCPQAAIARCMAFAAKQVDDVGSVGGQ